MESKSIRFDLHAKFRPVPSCVSEPLIRPLSRATHEYGTVLMFLRPYRWLASEVSNFSFYPLLSRLSKTSCLNSGDVN